jgi:hypothetical protein
MMGERVPVEEEGMGSLRRERMAGTRSMTNGCAALPCTSNALQIA